MRDAKEWIRRLELIEHPEGGWYREIYRAEESIPTSGLPRRFGGKRNFSTAIYFLLKRRDFSALHRIQQDEIWHFYDGTSVTIHTIDPSGNAAAVTLGRDVDHGENLVAVIPAGWLFGATITDPTSYGLVGCTVAPGFDFADFDMPSRDQLLEQYSQHHDLILGLTR